MNAEPLPRFDRAPDLRELLARLDGTRLLASLRTLLGAEVRIAGTHDDTVLGSDASPVPQARQALCGELETLGYLETAAPVSPQLEAAAVLIEMLLQGVRRYPMASDLHLEAVHADHEKLQRNHAALLESGVCYKALAENLEQRVTEHLQTLAATQRQLYQSEKLASIGQLAAGVAHEINNPIGFIISNLNTALSYVRKLADTINLIRQAPDIERVAAVFVQQDTAFLLKDFTALLGESTEGAGRIMRIVADLKGFSNIDRAEEELTDINQKIMQVCNVVRNTLQEHAALSTDLRELPLLRCYPGSIGQVLVNLLLNACQAMKTHGHIHVQTERAGDEICIRVRDDGCGIAPDVLPRIFDPFFTTKDVGQGTGLGLSVSHDIMRAHGGHIEVQSEVDVGSTFSLYLPLTPLAQA